MRRPIHNWILRFLGISEKPREAANLLTAKWGETDEEKAAERK